MLAEVIMDNARFWKFITIGLLATPLLLFFAFTYTGASHNDYSVAIILFPYAAFLIFTLGYWVPPVITIIFAIIQYPVYGYILDVAHEKKRLRLRILVLLLIHVSAVTVALIFRSKFPRV
jgi:hypothetical protein